MDKPEIVAIVRGVQPKSVSSVVQVLLEEGITWVEVSLSDEEAGLESIRVLNEEFGDQLHLGVGTVTRSDQVDHVLSAGAKYIITPGFDRELVQYIRSLDVPVFPGVFSPGEIMQAMNEGVEVFKLFPASTLGTKYIKDLRGPFPNLHFMAVGGVTKENLLDFFQAGCSSVAVGSDLIPRGATKDHLQQIRASARVYQNLLNQRK